jgi:hypothetical protein
LLLLWRWPGGGVAVVDSGWWCAGWKVVGLKIGSVRLRQVSPLKYSTLKSEVPRFDAKYYGASVRWPRLRPSSSRRAAQR